VAQWWELAIPAFGALVGGSLGAWIQAHNAQGQQRLQAEMATAERAATVQQENTVRFFEARRQAYTDFARTAYDIMAAADEYRRYYTEPEERKRTFADLYKAAGEMRLALVPAQLVGSAELAPIIQDLLLEMSHIAVGEGAVEHLDQLLKTFLDKARVELYEALVGTEARGGSAGSAH
jgi:hypothetical protein